MSIDFSCFSHVSYNSICRIPVQKIWKHGMALCRESENMEFDHDLSAKMLQDQTDTGTK